jgi:hypothetical protein
MKSLPTLLIFSAFIFINAEMWQVANDFTLPLFGMVMLLLAGIGGCLHLRVGSASHRRPRPLLGVG